MQEEAKRMEYRELSKLTVVKLRELAHQFEDIKGAIGMHKEELIDILCEKMSIEKPHRVVKKGVGRRKLKAEIRQLKKARDEAIASKDRQKLQRIRRKLHTKKRRLTRVTNM
jgi:hypothetical protein